MARKQLHLTSRAFHAESVPLADGKAAESPDMRPGSSQHNVSLSGRQLYTNKHDVLNKNHLPVASCQQLTPVHGQSQTGRLARCSAVFVFANPARVLD